jgi:uncharacterized membrane protein YfcA
MNSSAVLGTEVGIISETHRQAAKNKKIILFIMIPKVLGSIIGVWLLLTISPETVKYLMAMAVILLLAHAYIDKDKIKPESLSKLRYTLLFIFLFLIGIYSSFISLGGETIAKFAVISVLGFTFLKGQGIMAASGVPARLYTLIATSIAGLIVWPYVLTLWVSTFIAGKYATKFVKKIPDRYLKFSLTVVSAAFVAYLLFMY